MLSLFFLAIGFQSCVISKDKNSKDTTVKTSMIVMKIISADGNENFDRIVFKRSERIYRLAKDSKPEYLELLKDSQTNNSPVIIKRADEKSDLILSVEK